jgi:hypothetical protein
MRVLGWVLAVSVCAVLGMVGYYWVLQNAPVTAQLSLDLARFGAWRMDGPAPVTALMGASFGAGVVFTVLLMLLRWGLGSRASAEVGQDF